jgi:hypothetical protein
MWIDLDCLQEFPVEHDFPDFVQFLESKVGHVKLARSYFFPLIKLQKVQKAWLSSMDESKSAAEPSAKQPLNQDQIWNGEQTWNQDQTRKDAKQGLGQQEWK